MSKGVDGDGDYDYDDGDDHVAQERPLRLDK